MGSAKVHEMRDHSSHRHIPSVTGWSYFLIEREELVLHSMYFEVEVISTQPVPKQLHRIELLFYDHDIIML